MSYRQSLARTINGMIKNFMPFGGLLAIGAGILSKELVDRQWPELSTAPAVFCAIVIAMLMSVSIFVLLALLFAWIPSKEDTNRSSTPPPTENPTQRANKTDGEEPREPSS